MDKWQDVIIYLREIAKEKGISQQAIAEKIGGKRTAINRIFMLKVCPTIETVRLICVALDINIKFEENGNII
jgi:DNA-binding phage protein